MKFGTFIAQLPGLDIAALLRHIEALGFESVWLGDHIALRDDHKAHYPYSPNGRYQLPADYPFSDPFVLLAYAAAVTRTLKLATGVYLRPLRNPFTTAKAAATLDALSNGRFIFGVGMGWMSDEFELMGSNFEDRGRRMAEYMALMTECWSKPAVSFEGRTVRTGGFSFYPQPLQQPHPPFVLGGNTEASLKRAVLLGDGWFGIVTNMEEARALLARLAELERGAGRANRLERSLLLGWNASAQEVRQLADAGLDRVIDAGWFGVRDPLAYLTQYQFGQRAQAIAQPQVGRQIHLLLTAAAQLALDTVAARDYPGRCGGRWRMKRSVGGAQRLAAVVAVGAAVKIVDAAVGAANHEERSVNDGQRPPPG